jgi:outer membrane protein
MRTSIIVILFLTFGSGYTSRANGDPPEGKKYLLSECIQRALRLNPDIIRSQNAVDQSLAGKTAALGEFLPSLNATAGYTRYDKDQFGLRGDYFFVSRNSYSYGLSSQLLLFDGWRNFNTMNQSSLSVEASEYGLKRKVQDVVFAVEQSFFNLLRFQQLVTVNKSNFDRSQKQLDRVKELNAVGSSPMADVYRQQVQVGRDELALQQAEITYQNALVDFQALLGGDMRESFDIDPAGIPTSIQELDIKAYKAQLPDYNELVKIALAGRSDRQQAQVSGAIAAKSKDVAYAGFFPTLSASAFYGWNNMELANFQDYARFSGGLSISLPILSNLQTRAALERAAVEVKNSETMLEQIDRTVATEIRKALNALSSAEKTLEIANRTLLSATEDQRIATERYNLGAGTLLEQITANANFTAAQSDVINNTFNYLTARKQLDYQLGKTAITY